MTRTASADDVPEEVIIVTDSTVEHDLFTAPVPVSLVTRDDIDASGRTSIGDVLQALPAQANGANGQVNAAGDGATRIDLRGLGAARTLVLVNGRRFVNGGPGADASVDINSIPLAMIERVEIVKAGASTIYGADAIGGVVNVVTRAQFDGTEATLLTGTSQHGDGSELDASFVRGFTSDDKSTFVAFSGGYQRHGAVFASDRAFSNGHIAYDFETKTARRLFSLVPGDTYNESETTYLSTPSTRYNVFATGGRRLGPNTALFAELLFQHRNSDRQLSPVTFDAESAISKDSIYNATGADITDVRRRLLELGPRTYLDDLTVARFVIGFQGRIPEGNPLAGWQYEVAVDYGEAKALAGTTGQLLRSRVADALGPSMVVNGTPICVRVPGDAATQITYTVQRPHGGTTTTACVPLNLLASTIPAEQLAGLTYTDGGTGLDTAQALVATANGRLARLPHHGEILAVVGADVRTDSGSQSPPSVASSGDSTDTQTQSTEGDLDVAEGYGELSTRVGKAELDLGARALHYSHGGSQVIYKASGLVHTVEGITLRGTYATAFRAPSFFDLYGGHLQRRVFAQDPLNPDTLQQTTEIGGNPALKAESAATASIGIIAEPRRGLAISADYWHIAIDDAIETLGIQTIFANCYDRGIQSFCDQIHRDPATHRIYQVEQLLQNVPRTTTSGLDLAVAHEAKLGDYGRVRTTLEAQYLFRYDLDTGAQTLHGAGVYDLGAYPHWKAIAASHWMHPSGVAAGLIARFVGSFEECANNDCNLSRATARDVGRYFKLDLYARYELKDVGKTTLQLGVVNALDATPPIVYNAAEANSDAATYDFTGRMVYLRMAQRF